MQRRTVLRPDGLAAAAPWRPAAQAAPLTKPIPSSGEQLPVVGLGTWITFNVGNDAPRPAGVGRGDAGLLRRRRAPGRLVADVRLVAVGGRRRPAEAGPPAAAVLGRQGLDVVRRRGAGRGLARLWGVPRFDLLQVHNLLAWEKQLPLLLAMKQAGRLRYVGITTSEGRRNKDFEQLMRQHPLDTVQLTYNPLDREAEQRLLPLARERGMAVIVNRPFREGDLLRGLRRQPLPGWAADIGCTTWAQAVLKFIVSHPAVTCAIPATTSVEHVRENLAAAAGAMPDEALRRRIAADVGRFA
jgi:hypothetical protein